MCGIAGYACSDAGDPWAHLEAARDTLVHRGPDDAGLWISKDKRAGLAHRRLSILDLTPSGRQPMADATGALRITFNGEIYNHRELRAELSKLGHTFRSTSDTEVILEAYREWDEECLGRLEGMFAFALVDDKRRRLFLARDRAGEKPLYFTHRPGTLRFASEIKALLADPQFPRRLDAGALEFYLACGYVPADRCLLRDVRKLPPAHALSYDLDHDAFRIWRYWHIPDPDGASRAEEDLLEELEGLLRASVERQLIADVPVGILLSGGIDSSLVTAPAAAAGPVRTFTIAFPGHGSLDESAHARRVASHFGTRHEELAAEPPSADLLKDLARQFDEPIADPSLVPTYLVARLVRPHAKAALGGDGGDELFGGYLHYSAILKRPVRGRSIVRAAAERLPLGLPGRNRLLFSTMAASERLSNSGVYFDRAARRKLVAGKSAREDAPLEWWRGMWSDGRSVLENATRLDFQTYLPEDILVKVDRAAMMASLEVRAPWLDHKLAEFAFAKVPDRLKTTAKERKILPRRLARRLLPKDLDLDRKQGFSPPLAAWFRGPWGALAEDVLRDSKSGIFNRDAVDRLLRGQKRGMSHGARIFALTMFELWRSAYKVEPG